MIQTCENAGTPDAEDGSDVGELLGAAVGVGLGETSGETTGDTSGWVADGDTAVLGRQPTTTTSAATTVDAYRNKPRNSPIGPLSASCRLRTAPRRPRG